MAPKKGENDATKKQGSTKGGKSKKPAKKPEKPETVEESPEEKPTPDTGPQKQAARVVQSTDPDPLVQPPAPKKPAKRRKTTKPTGRPKGAKDKKPRKRRSDNDGAGSDTTGSDGDDSDGMDPGAGACDDRGGGGGGVFPALPSREQRAADRLNGYLALAESVTKDSLPPKMTADQRTAVWVIWYPYVLDNIEAIEAKGSMPFWVLALMTAAIFKPQLSGLISKARGAKRARFKPGRI